MCYLTKLNASLSVSRIANVVSFSVSFIALIRQLYYRELRIIK